MNEDTNNEVYMVEPKVDSDIFIPNAKEKFPDAFQEVTLDDGTKIDVLAPLEGKNFGKEVKIGEYTPYGVVSIFRVPGEGIFAIDMVSSGDPVDVKQIMWNQIKRFVDLRIQHEKTNGADETGMGISKEGKFYIDVEFNNGMRLPGVTGVRFDLDTQGFTDDLLKAISSADEKVKEEKKETAS